MPLKDGRTLKLNTSGIYINSKTDFFKIKIK